MPAKTCRVFEIARGSTHDGPGMRTTIFFKGCPLNCWWCQNPEGISGERETWRDADRCIGCLECISACSAGALSAEEHGVVCDRKVCALCGACTEACPSRAMEFTSREWDLDALVNEALKDSDYYNAFGGGVTASGGEPLCQHEFVSVFFQHLHVQGVQTALDTCGMAAKEAFDSVLQHTDHLLFDIKFIDNSMHKKYTGQYNNRILENLDIAAEYMRRSRSGKKSQPGNKRRLWIRTPLIPGVTATARNIHEIGKFIIQRHGDVTERWELCSFNSACANKYHKLGLDWMFKDAPLFEQKDVDALKESALSSGFEHSKLVTSGFITKKKQ